MDSLSHLCCKISFTVGRLSGFGVSTFWIKSRQFFDRLDGIGFISPFIIFLYRAEILNGSTVKGKRPVNRA